MDSFFWQKFSIDDHPVSRLKLKRREEYLSALGTFLCNHSNNDPIVEFVFNRWADSIMQKETGGCYWNSDYLPSKVKRALKIKRDGFHFYTFQKSFLFDCVYLCHKTNSNIWDKIESVLRNEVCGFLSRKRLKKLTLFIENGALDTNIPIELLNHYRENESFLAKKPIRILVVAPMNAGKSTLINAIVGRKIVKTGMTSRTSAVTRIYNNPFETQGEFSHENRLANISDSTVIFSGQDNNNIAIKFNSHLQDEKVCLVDTPGLNYHKDESHQKITLDTIAGGDYDIILYVCDSTNLFTVGGKKSLEDVLKGLKPHNEKKKIVFALNKLDLYKIEDDSAEDDIDSLKNELKKMGCLSPNIVAVSARDGLNAKSKELNISYDLHKFNKNGGMNENQSELLKTGLLDLERQLITL